MPLFVDVTCFQSVCGKRYDKTLCLALKFLETFIFPKWRNLQPINQSINQSINIYTSIYIIYIYIYIIYNYIYIYIIFIYITGVPEERSSFLKIVSPKLFGSS